MGQNWSLVKKKQEAAVEDFYALSCKTITGESVSISDYKGKTLLIVNMFVGRIGLLTVLATLIKPDSRPASGKPSENILLT